MAGETGDVTMETARALCNFCCSNTRCEPQKQDTEALSMETEVRRLRVLTRRMTGRDLDGLSFPELELLETRLRHVYQTVKNLKSQVEQEEVERMLNQKKQAPPSLGSGTGRLPLVRCSFSGVSSQEIPQKQVDGAPKPVSALQRAYERRLAEPMETEFERLWLLNERMNGRKLEGMDVFEVRRLECQILDSMNRILAQKLEPGTEEEARRLKEESIHLLAEQERCSLDNVKDEDRHYGIALRFRPQRRHTRLSVSRKIRRVQRRNHMIRRF